MKKKLAYNTNNQEIIIIEEPISDIQHELIFHKLPFPEVKEYKFTFIDLFT